MAQNGDVTMAEHNLKISAEYDDWWRSIFMVPFLDNHGIGRMYGSQN